MKIRRALISLMYHGMGSKLFIHLKYLKAHRRVLKLSKPARFTEKIQSLKFASHKEPLEIEADKYLSRFYVQNLIGSEAIVPLLFVTDNVSDLLNKKFGEPFIIKPTHSSGNYLIVRNYEDFDFADVQELLRSWLDRKFYMEGHETQYKYIKPRIIVEKLLDDNGKLPLDYKFHCFSGKVEFIYLSIDREGQNIRQIRDLSWNPLPFEIARTKSVESQPNEYISNSHVEPPKELTKMIEMAEKLSQERPYVRIDLFNVNGDVYFSEITHFHSSGFNRFFPDEVDFKYGSKINLDV